MDSLFKELIIQNLAELPLVAKEIIAYGAQSKIWLFIGEMGAGKTTLIKEICNVQGVIDQVSSPTFSIVNEYETKDAKTLYHFDFYRLHDIEEAYGIGAEDYFYSGHLCLIEWPQIIADLLPEDYMTVHIEELLSGERKIILKHHG